MNKFRQGLINSIANYIKYSLASKEKLQSIVKEHFEYMSPKFESISDISDILTLDIDENTIKLNIIYEKRIRDYSKYEHDSKNAYKSFIFKVIDIKLI